MLFASRNAMLVGNRSPSATCSRTSELSRRVGPLLLSTSVVPLVLKGRSTSGKNAMALMIVVPATAATADSITIVLFFTADYLQLSNKWGTEEEYIAVTRHNLQK